MKYPRKWEEINDDRFAGCARLKVFGGWLIVAWVNTRKKIRDIASLLPENLLFIPDPKHEWELE